MNKAAIERVKAAAADASSLTPEERERFARFARRLGELLDAESCADGLAGVLIGYGIGVLFRDGGTETDARECVERIMQQSVRLLNAAQVTS